VDRVETILYGVAAVGIALMAIGSYIIIMH
jgi:hypothetical protein